MNPADSARPAVDPVMAELLAQAARRLDSLSRVTEGIAAVRATRSSTDGMVTVTVDGSGGVVDLRLADGVARLGVARFGQTVVDVSAEASAAAFVERARITTDFSEEFADLVGREPDRDDTGVTDG